MARAIIAFVCRNPGCGKIIEEVFDISDPNFAADRMSEGEVSDEHYANCPGCLAEYEIETINGFGGLTASLQPDGDLIDAYLDHSDEVLGFDDFEPAKDPLSEYRQAADGLEALLSQSGDNPASILNRMIFSQCIATMEAYLTDKLLQLCSLHPEIEQRVVERATIFKDAKISLADVVKDPAASKRHVQASLQAVLYHDLDKVKGLYQIAVQGQVFPTDKTEQCLRKAVSLRHDCVHRNGMTKDGELNRFDAAYISEVAEEIDRLVLQVEESAEKAIKAIRDAEPY